AGGHAIVRRAARRAAHSRRAPAVHARRKDHRRPRIGRRTARRSLGTIERRGGEPSRLFGGRAGYAVLGRSLRSLPARGTSRPSFRRWHPPPERGGALLDAPEKATRLAVGAFGIKPSSAMRAVVPGNHRSEPWERAGVGGAFRGRRGALA